MIDSYPPRAQPRGVVMINSHSRRHSRNGTRDASNTDITENMDAVMRHLFQKQRLTYPPAFYDRIAATVMRTLLGDDAPPLPPEARGSDPETVLPLSEYRPSPEEMEQLRAAFMRKFMNETTSPTGDI